MQLSPQECHETYFDYIHFPFAEVGVPNTSVSLQMA